VTDADELRTLRARVLALEQVVSSSGDVFSARPTFAAQTVTVSSYPTSATSTYGLKRIRITGNEIEGAVVMIATYGSVFYGNNLGSAIPASGTNLLVSLSDGGRFTFRYDG